MCGEETATIDTPSSGAFFIREGDHWLATEHGRGPWSPEHLHAGPPSALLARAIQRAARDDPAQQVTRLTVELMSPVPLAPLSVECSLLRAGRKSRRIEATLRAGSRTLARATGLAIRTETLDLPAVARVPHPLPPPPEAGTPFRFPVFHSEGGYSAAVDARLVQGGHGINPTSVWIRARVPLVAGEETAPLERVMIAADSGNGIAVVLDPRRYSFVNADLTVYVHRLPVDEWVCLEAATTAEPSGVGLTASRLYDRSGPIGWSLQGLLIEARP